MLYKETGTAMKGLLGVYVTKTLSLHKRPVQGMLVAMVTNLAL